MAISVRASGTWAVATTQNPVVTIPAGYQAGDLGILISAWRPFGTTATVDQSWVEIVDATGGSTANGVGVGSTRLFVAYKVLAATETNPTLTRSTTITPGGQVIIVLQKAANETWNVAALSAAVEQAMATTAMSHTLTTTGAIASGDWVFAFTGVADDSAAFTRATDAISGGPTWSGNVVEYPATHASSTTGNDMAADNIYRVAASDVASGQTITVTATLSAAERVGSVLFRVRVIKTASAAITITHASSTSAAQSKGAQGAATASHASAVAIVHAKGARGSIAITHATATSPTARKDGRSATSLTHASSTSATGERTRGGSFTVTHASAVTVAGRKGGRSAITVAHVTGTTATKRKGGRGAATVAHSSSVTITKSAGRRSAITIAHASGVSTAGRKGGLGAITVAHTTATTGTDRKGGRGSFSVTHSSATAATGERGADDRFGSFVITHASGVVVSGRKGAAASIALTHATGVTTEARKDARSAIALALASTTSADWATGRSVALNVAHTVLTAAVGYAGILAFRSHVRVGDSAVTPSATTGERLLGPVVTVGSSVIGPGGRKASVGDALHGAARLSVGGASTDGTTVGDS